MIIVLADKRQNYLVNMKGDLFLKNNKKSENTEIKAKNQISPSEKVKYEVAQELGIIAKTKYKKN